MQLKRWARQAGFAKKCKNSTERQMGQNIEAKQTEKKKETLKNYASLYVPPQEEKVGRYKTNSASTRILEIENRSISFHAFHV